ncbi:MAG TPA: PaaI family thioesterase [Acidimicrobiales bacterium]|nr:PaaI family thioesterase [Acidimicrobiales bacterium]
MPEQPAETPGDYFPTSPVIGPLNALAPPIKFEVKEGKICGTARFGVAYQGPPGCVHGGVIAEFFDELLGASNMVAGNGGLTGKLTIRYRSTTPLYADLRFEGISLPPMGRKVHAKGSLWCGDRLCADAEGIFVMVDPERFREITVAPHEAAGS